MIETSGLSKQFNDFWAVSDLTLTVRPGQILAVSFDTVWLPKFR